MYIYIMWVYAVYGYLGKEWGTYNFSFIIFLIKTNTLPVCSDGVRQLRRKKRRGKTVTIRKYPLSFVL